jgi:hypothetical protein
VFWVISVYFNIRNALLKYGTFLLGHPVYLSVLVLFNDASSISDYIASDDRMIGE